MVSQHEKEQEAYTGPRLDLRQKLMLGDWCAAHEQDCRTKTYQGLAQQASADPALGFKVTKSNIDTICIARFGYKQKRVKRGTGSGSEKSITELMARLAECERRLALAGV
jgi:hypothetical protein